MSLYDDYRNTDYLDDVSFIAGTEYTFNFPVYDNNNALVNVNGATLDWVLGLYGQPESGSFIHKTVNPYDDNSFQVTLTEEDTIDYGGMIYLQQMRITDITGKKTRPAQGIIIIRKAIPID